MTEQKEYCVVCSKELQIDEIHSTVKDMHKRLFMGNGDSIVTQVRLHEEAIEILQNHSAKAGNRWWEFSKLMIAAALPIIVLWLAHRL